MRLALKILVVLIVTVAFAVSAFAVGKGKTLEFAGGSEGKVIFDGGIHADKGAKCADCHKEGVFKAMKKGTVKITMADMDAGKNCGTCHNGEKAFSSKDKANCGKCHKK